MKPIDFKEKNTDIAKNQPEYLTLPAYVVDNTEGEIIFCMGLSFKERMRLLFTGKLWCCFLTFGKKMTPSRFSTKKRDFFGSE